MTSLIDHCGTSNCKPSSLFYPFLRALAQITQWWHFFVKTDDILRFRISQVAKYGLLFANPPFGLALSEDQVLKFEKMNLQARSCWRPWINFHGHFEHLIRSAHVPQLISTGLDYSTRILLDFLASRDGLLYASQGIHLNSQYDSHPPFFSSSEFHLRIHSK